MTTLSRRHWRAALSTHLQACDPTHWRWLQSHPRRAEILNELTSDAIDMWIEATAARADPHSPPSPWTWATLEEMAEIVVARTVETPDLWEDLDEAHPRLPAETKPDPIGPLQLIPPTGPTRPRSPRRL